MRPEGVFGKVFVYVGAATSPAGPLPISCPVTVDSSGLKPSSSTGTPNADNFDS